MQVKDMGKDGDLGGASDRTRGAAPNRGDIGKVKQEICAKLRRYNCQTTSYNVRYASHLTLMVASRQEHTPVARNYNLLQMER